MAHLGFLFLGVAGAERHSLTTPRRTQSPEAAIRHVTPLARGPLPHLARRGLGCSPFARHYLGNAATTDFSDTDGTENLCDL